MSLSHGFRLLGTFNHGLQLEIEFHILSHHHHQGLTFVSLKVNLIASINVDAVKHEFRITRSVLRRSLNA